MNRIAAALAIICLFCVGLIEGHDLKPREYKLGEWGKVTIEKDAQCVVAGELMGHWVTHTDLTERLTHEENPAPYELVFSESEESRLRIKAAVEKHFEFLEKNTGKDVADWLRRDAQTAYLAGACELHAGKTIAKSDFLLIASAATPHLILLMDGQLQSCNVMLARDPKGDNDILFMGGDQTKEGFAPLKRKK
ncbi:hypothetical protein BAC2_00931 [uncultured bacterium]|nr:hypothetical protein BAC2_00931 [uncultured bacterium]